MKKILISFAFITSFFVSKAQLSGIVDWSDTSVSYIGLISAIPLVNIKDSFSVASNSKFKILTKQVFVRALNYQNITAGTPPYVVSADDSGQLKKYAFPFFAPTIDTLSSSRAFGTSYLMSSTKYVEVKICASITCTLSLSGGTAGSVFLETSPDNVTWTTKAQLQSSNTGTLTIGLNTSQISGGQLSTLLPPNYFWRARTSSTTGTATFSMAAGEKITY